MSQLLQIPLRARLTTQRQNVKLYWRSLLVQSRVPRGTLLLDTFIEKLPRRKRK